MIASPCRSRRGGAGLPLLHAVTVLTLALSSLPVGAAVAAPQAAVPSGPAAAVASAETVPAPDRSAELGRELARLDERLSLDTYPDGTGEWLARRLAAALERRLREGRAAEGPSAMLERQLASRLWGLGADRDLDGPGARAAGPPEAKRLDAVAAVLETVLRLHRKLDLLTAPPGPEPAGSTVAPPANDACADALAVGPGRHEGSSVGATTEGASSCGLDEGADVWFRYTAGSAGPVSFDSIPSDFDTVLTAYDACPGDGGTELACDDDQPRTDRARLGLDLAAGQTVLLRLSGNGSAAADHALVIAEGGGFRGRVTRAFDGAPVADLEMLLFPNSASEALRSTQTAADGSYAFLGVEDWTYYRLQSQSDGTYLDEAYDGAPCLRWQSCRQGYEHLRVTIGTVTDGIDFSLERAGFITGRVTDRAGQPLLAYVDLYDGTGARLTTVQSGEDGRYEVGGLPAGTYYVTAEADEHRTVLYDAVPCADCSVLGGTPVVVAEGGTTANVDFQMDRLGVLEGTVTHRVTGAPVVSIVVAAYRDGNRVGQDYTDGDGAWRIGRLDEASYRVSTHSGVHRNRAWDDLPCIPYCTSTDGDPVALAYNQTVSGLDFALDSLGVISGTVTGAPGATDFVVRLLDPSQSYPVVKSAYTREGNDYLFDAVEPGTYRLLAEGPHHRPELYDGVLCVDNCYETEGDPLVVDLNTRLDGTDFVLERLGRVAGRVVESGSGEPLRSAWVEARSTDEGVFISNSGRTDADGYFLIQDLEPDEYVFYATSETHRGEVWHEHPCEEVCDPQIGEPRTVELGSTIEGIDFTLDRKGEIVGTVTDASSGAPLVDVRVRLRGTDGTDPRSAFTDAAGQYRIPHLEKGGYILHTDTSTHVDEVFDDQPCGTFCDFATATAVEADYGVVTTGIDFALAPLSEISGRVTETGGAGVGWARVEVIHAATLYREGPFQTDGEGYYRLRGLDAGTYFVIAWSPDHLPEVYDGLACAAPCGFSSCRDSCDLSAGTTVEVGEGATAGGIDFQLDRLAVIGGRVTSGGFSLSLEGIDLYDTAGQRVEQELTNHDGTYRFRVPAGTYHVVTSTGGYQDQVYDGIPCPPSCDPTVGTSLAVGLNEEITGIDFSLLRLGSVAGRVTEEGTDGYIDLAFVNLYDSEGNYVDVGRATPGYLIESLEPGTYYARTSTATHADEIYDDLPCVEPCDVTTGTPIVVELETRTSGIDFALAPARGSIAGRVVDSVTGAGLWNVEVIAYDGSGSTYYGITADGDYLIYDVPPGAWSVRTDAGFEAYRDQVYDGSVTVAVGATTTGIDFVLDPLGSIEGTVTLADPSNSFVDVEVYDTEGTWVTGGSGASWEATHLLPGTYYLRARDIGGIGVTEHQDELYDDVPCEPDCDVTQGTPVVVGVGSRITGIDFYLNACSGPSFQELWGEIFFSTATAQACAVLTAGDGTTVHTGADVTFKAGRKIVLGDGFSVRDGARFRAVVEAEWGAEPQ